MNNSHLQYTVDKVHTELQKRNITILCETYDGQWHKHIIENNLSMHLTKLHGKETRNKCCVLSKDKCTEKVNQMTIIKKSTLQQILSTSLDILHGILFPGLCIEKGSNSQLFIESEQRRMQHVHSIHPKSWRDLFQPIEVTDENETIPETFLWSNTNEPHKRFKLVSKFSLKSTDHDTAVWKKMRNKKTVGLQENEESLLDIIKPQNTSDEDLANTNADNFQTRNENITLETILKNTDCPLLPNIINELSNTNPLKWNGETADEIFPYMLSDGNVVQKQTTIKELQVILNEMRCCTGRIWITSNMNKSQMVNSVVKAFGGNIFVSEEMARKQKRNFDVDTLVQMCTNVLKNHSYPIKHLQIPLGTLY